MARELAPFNIHVNGVAPGTIATDLNAARLASEREREDSIARIPLGRIGSTADTVGPVAFLCSSASNDVVGHTLVIDGGWLTQTASSICLSSARPFGRLESPAPPVSTQEYTDMLKLKLLSTALATAVFAHGAMAQASSPSRAEVKAETRQAAKEGKLATPVDGTLPAASGTSTKTRAERKSETRAAEKAGKLAPAGEGALPTEATAGKSTKTRAERKAETRAAEKAGKLTPAGEGVLPNQK